MSIFLRSSLSRNALFCRNQGFLKRQSYFSSKQFLLPQQWSFNFLFHFYQHFLYVKKEKRFKLCSTKHNRFLLNEKYHSTRRTKGALPPVSLFINLYFYSQVQLGAFENTFWVSWSLTFVRTPCSFFIGCWAFMITLSNGWFFAIMKKY